MIAPELVHEYADQGISVLPLHTAPEGRCSCGDAAPDHAAAKHPRTRNGKNDATTRHDQIEQWAARWPGCNWGGRPPASVFVLDVDPRNGGLDSLAKLELEHGPLPRTLTAKSGGGGLHYWLTGETRLGRVPGHEGLDIKTSTGYLVLPPSVHASGGLYEWLEDEIAAHAPNWLHEVLNPPVRVHHSGGGRRSLDGLVRFVAALTTNRNEGMFWAACRVAQNGGDPAILRDAALSTGLPADEVDKSLESARRTYGAK